MPFGQAAGERQFTIPGCGRHTIKQGDRLAGDLRKQVLPLDAEFIERTEYGEMFRIHGVLTDPNQRSLRVVGIWMSELETCLTQFITLYPAKD